MEYAEDQEVKSIVFSQFCAMLDLIEFRLKREGIHCAQLTGSMSAVARYLILFIPELLFMFSLYAARSACVLSLAFSLSLFLYRAILSVYA